MAAKVDAVEVLVPFIGILVTALMLLSKFYCEDVKS